MLFDRSSRFGDKEDEDKRSYISLPSIVTQEARSTIKIVDPWKVQAPSSSSRGSDGIALRDSAAVRNLVSIYMMY